MPCYSPVSAWQTEDGEIVFKERGDLRRAITFPCGQCYGCRLDRSRKWAIRCVHEASCHEFNSFVTLTYEKAERSLDYSDFQKFMKRVRKHFGPTRFFMCGEYGEQNWRPHFHALLFGRFFSDRVLHSERDGVRLYRSELLDKLWKHGFCTIGDVNFETASYTARYIMKKRLGKDAEDYYTRMDTETGEIYQLVPEFARMSLKPGIGAEWFEKFHTDVFNSTRDHIIVNGQKCAVPRYYREYLDRIGLWDQGEEIDFRRYLRSAEGREDRTPERLAVRERVAKAKGSFYKREL